MAVVRPDRRDSARADDCERRGRRAEPRAQITFPASVEALEGRQHISLIEVSQAGARLEGSHLPPVGTDVILRCGAIDAFATVVWAVDGRCGVHFDDPVSPRELVEMRHLSVAAERTRMTPGEIQAAADWLNGVAR